MTALMTDMNPNFYVKSLITASHCCVCRKALEDTESVQNGIGPVCSRRYYDPTHVPTEEDVMNALGLLHKGLVESKFPADLINLLRGLKGDARKFSNALVYFTSANYDKRDTVLACAEIIRALGYNVMADKLEVDRVKVRIVEDGDNLKVYLANASHALRDLGRVPGAKNDLPKEGTKVGWTVPKAQRDYLMCIIGIHFHGDLLAVAGQGISRIPRKSWYDLQKFRNPQPVNPVAPPPPAPLANTLSALASHGMVEIVVGTPLRVRTPFNAGFVAALHRDIPRNEHRWDGSCWSISARHLDLVRNLVQMHFGVNL